MKITFLGSGANGGVPQLDCRCKNCERARKNRGLKRRRSSLLVESCGKRILIDCGPDFNSQMQRANLKLQDLDLVVLTHLHFDHVGGLMELSAGKKCGVRVFTSVKSRQRLLSGDTSFLFKTGFAELSKPDFGDELKINLVKVKHDPNFETVGVVIREKGKSVWISPDCQEISKRAKTRMSKCDLIIFDGTFWDDKDFPSAEFHHMPIKDSLPIFRHMGKRVIFTHINHSEDSNMIISILRDDGALLAKDGMVINL